MDGTIAVHSLRYPSWSILVLRSDSTLRWIQKRKKRSQSNIELWYWKWRGSLALPLGLCTRSNTRVHETAKSPGPAKSHCWRMRGGEEERKGGREGGREGGRKREREREREKDRKKRMYALSRSSMATKPIIHEQIIRWQTRTNARLSAIKRASVLHRCD